MTDVFGDDQSQNDPNDVGSWVGDGKKYATQEDALKAIPHSQNHIAKLEEENQKLRAQVEEAQRKSEEGGNVTAEDLLKAIQAQAKAPEVSSAQTPQLDEKALTNIVNSTLDQRTAAQTASDNLATAQAALVEKFGDAQKANQAVQAKAAELGVEVGFLKSLASNSPKALLSYFDNPKQEGDPKPNPTPAHTNTGVANPNPTGTVLTPGTPEYYADMRKNNPDRYYSFAVTEERRKLVEEGKLSL